MTAAVDADIVCICFEIVRIVIFSYFIWFRLFRMISFEKFCKCYFVVYCLDFSSDIVFHRLYMSETYVFIIREREWKQWEKIVNEEFSILFEPQNQPFFRFQSCHLLLAHTQHSSSRLIHINYWYSHSKHTNILIPLKYQPAQLAFYCCSRHTQIVHFHRSMRNCWFIRS